MAQEILGLSDATVIRDDRYGTVFELAGSASGLPNLGFAIVEVDVGATSPAHYHTKTSELYYITEGTGIMVMGAQETIVKPGDCISIAAQYDPCNPQLRRRATEIPLRYEPRVRC